MNKYRSQMDHMDEDDPNPNLPLFFLFWIITTFFLPVFPAANGTFPALSLTRRHLSICGVPISSLSIFSILISSSPSHSVVPEFYELAGLKWRQGPWTIGRPNWVGVLPICGDQVVLRYSSSTMKSRQEDEQVKPYKRRDATKGRDHLKLFLSFGASSPLNNKP